MRKAIFSVLFACAICTVGLTAQAGDSHPVAQPYMDAFEYGEPSYRVDRERAEDIPIDHLVLGAEHILDQQCYNGGFGWPHDDCSVTYHHITGPILLGTLSTFYFTRDPSHIVGALAGGAFDLSYQYDNGESRFGTFTAVFMLDLAAASDNATFSTFASTGLFDELAAGTFSPNDYDTAGWITIIQIDRTGPYINLRSWEFHTLIRAARILGQPGQDGLFEQAVLDGLATLDNSDPGTVFSDTIGLAGAVRGLADARRYTFPTIVAPLQSGVNGIDNLEDLAAYLVSLQNPNGSWNWHSNVAAPATGDEDVQTTAYATLALLEVDIMTAANYQPATESARNYLLSMQLPNGGFPEWPGGPENTEVEGEAVTAVASFDATIFVDGFESGTTNLWSSIAP